MNEEPNTVTPESVTPESVTPESVTPTQEEGIKAPPLMAAAKELPKIPWMGFRRINKITNQESLNLHIALSASALEEAIKKIRGSDKKQTVLLPVDTKFISPDDITTIEIYDPEITTLEETMLGSLTARAKEQSRIIRP